MKDYSGFRKNTDALYVSKEALQALKEVARQTRHYRKPYNVAIFGKNGHFDKVVPGLSPRSDSEQILKQAITGSSEILFVHGHLKDMIIDAADVCFDYRLLSSGDVTDLVTRQNELGDKFKLYTACVSCDENGNATIQVVSYDGTACVQFVNLCEEGGGKLENNPFEGLIQLEKLVAKY